MSQTSKKGFSSFKEKKKEHQALTRKDLWKRLSKATSGERGEEGTAWWRDRAAELLWRPCYSPPPLSPPPRPRWPERCTEPSVPVQPAVPRQCWDCQLPGLLPLPKRQGSSKLRQELGAAERHRDPITYSSYLQITSLSQLATTTKDLDSNSRKQHIGGGKEKCGKN